MSAASRCELLLVVGVSLKASVMFDLVYDLAAKVHEQYGAVIYVGQDSIRGRNTNHTIDFHLRVDVEDFSARVRVAMDQVRF
jgi:NAD-dependent SIR2 family protein deacetylase